MEHLSWIIDSIEKNFVLFVVHKDCSGCRPQAYRVINLAEKYKQQVEFHDLNITHGGITEQKAYDAYLYDPDGRASFETTLTNSIIRLGNGIVFNATNHRSVGVSTLDHCSIFGANNINAIFPNGGALTIYNSDNVIVKNCHFGWNNAQLGGAVYIESSNPHC